LESELKVYLKDSFEALLFNITSELTTQTGSLIAAGEGNKSFYSLTILPILTVIASGVAEIVVSTIYISSTVAKILIGIETLPKTIEDLLKHQLE